MRRIVQEAEAGPAPQLQFSFAYKHSIIWIYIQAPFITVLYVDNLTC